ncbi:MAG: hypothetical protein METHP_02162 [Methanoregula sp. SKADARSKE-2]|nr:MAG: hypothetical protein METHP_02162 [Methanoregula sp. SKADARSKE-2]
MCFISLAVLKNPHFFRIIQVILRNPQRPCHRSLKLGYKNRIDKSLLHIYVYRKGYMRSFQKPVYLNAKKIGKIFNT